MLKTFFLPSDGVFHGSLMQHTGEPVVPLLFFVRPFGHVREVAENRSVRVYPVNRFTQFDVVVYMCLQFRFYPLYFYNMHKRHILNAFYYINVLCVSLSKRKKPRWYIVTNQALTSATAAFLVSSMMTTTCQKDFRTFSDRARKENRNGCWHLQHTDDSSRHVKYITIIKPSPIFCELSLWNLQKSRVNLKRLQC